MVLSVSPGSTDDPEATNVNDPGLNIAFAQYCTPARYCSCWAGVKSPGWPDSKETWIVDPEGHPLSALPLSSSVDACVSHVECVSHCPSETRERENQNHGTDGYTKGGLQQRHIRVWIPLHFALP